MATGSFGRRVIARTVRRVAQALPLLLATAVGCSGPGGGHCLPDPVLSRVLVNRGPADDYHNADADAVSGLALAMQGAAPARPAGRPMNVLCVSGGGKYAAFTAGVLCGWTATGTRPPFDVATGVSSGAPTALMAFLGPKYDSYLTDLFLHLRRSDLYTWRPIRGVLTGSSMMSSRPLAELLAGRLNETVLADLREAHTAGRRLFIATANAQTHHMAVWDVGAIACSGRPDAAALVRKVILAACSIPGLTDPVEFDVTVNGVRYVERHADAGNLAQVFVRTASPLTPDSAVWVLSAGKTYPNPTKSGVRALETILTAVSATLYSLFRADTVKLYALCGVTRSRFRLIALPQDFQVRASSMRFDPAESERMYLIGYQMGTGAAWQEYPPDATPGEASPPRAGVEFVTPQ